MSSTLSSSKRERGLSLEMLQCQGPHQACRVNFWFACSCGRKLRVPLELRVDLGGHLVSPQGSEISFCVERGTFRFLTHRCRISGASSGGEAGSSAFLSISDIDLGVSADLVQGSQASSCAEAWNSACLSSCSWDVRPLVKLYLEAVSFSRGCN